MVSALMVRRGLIFSVAATCVTALALAKDPHPGDVNAALQAHDHMLHSYSQSGAFAGGYRPMSAYSYTKAAAAHADALNAYAGVSQVPAETAQEHLTEIQRNLEASNKEMKKIDASQSKGAADVHQLAQTIQTHNDAAEQAAKAAQAEAAKGGTVTIAGNANYAVMTHHINAAAAAHRQMLKSLGIEAH